jgi:hypothetical protein
MQCTLSAVRSLGRRGNGTTYPYDGPWDDPGAADLVRRLLGDQAWMETALPKRHDMAVLNRVELAFPEAVIMIMVGEFETTLHRWNLTPDP